MGLNRWHFTSAVSGNCFRSIYGFINSVRGKDAVVVLGQDRQIGRRHLELLAGRSLPFPSAPWQLAHED